MTDPNYPPPSDLSYQSALPFGNAPMLVKLAAIFMLISAGLTGIGVLYMIFNTFFITYLFTHPAAGGGPPPPPLPFPSWIFSVLYGGLAAVALVVAILKSIAGVKLLRGGSHAWAWALTGAILSCIELMWCSIGCVLPLAGGVYTIIVLCQQKVQAYMRNRAANPTLPADPQFPA